MKYLATILILSLSLTTFLCSQDSTPPFPIPIDAPEHTPAEQVPPSDDSGMGRFMTEMLHMLVTLGLILGAMLIGAWVLKRFLNTRTHQMNLTSSIKILERRSLTPKSAVYLIDVYGKGIVIAESQAGIHRIAEIDLPPEEEESTAESTSSFGQILKDKFKSSNR